MQRRSQSYEVRLEVGVGIVVIDRACRVATSSVCTLRRRRPNARCTAAACFQIHFCVAGGYRGRPRGDGVLPGRSVRCLHVRTSLSSVCQVFCMQHRSVDSKLTINELPFSSVPRVMYTRSGTHVIWALVVARRVAAIKYTLRCEWPQSKLGKNLAWMQSSCTHCRWHESAARN